MNRCTPRPPTRLAASSLTLVAAWLCLATGAMAQQVVRPFPATAQRGTLQITHPPELLMDGKAGRLSPGARIRGTNNMLVMSGALAGQTLLVNYVREPQGLVHDVWILTEAEAKVAPPKP